MKKYNYIILMLVFALTACDADQWLEETEMGINQVTTNFDNYQVFDDFTRSAYFSLKSPGQYGVIDFNINRTILSDVVTEHPSTTRLDFEEVYDRDNESNNKQPLMFGVDGSFVVLQAVNRVINYWEDNPDAEFEDDPYKPLMGHMRGECYFLRAYTHFMNSLIFAPPYQSAPEAPGVIMRTRMSKSATDYKARSVNRVVYEQIIADLKQAETLLRSEYSSDMPQDFQDRLFKPAAQALLARVLFIMGEQHWDEALAYANKVIESGEYPLVASSELGKIFSRSGLGKKVSETIWYTTYYFRNAWRSPRWERHFTTKNGKNRGYAFSQSILNKVGWDNPEEAVKDLRYANWCQRYERGEDPAYTELYDRDYYVWNFKFNPHAANFVNLRSAELYLIRANIKLKKGSAGEALNDVNLLRTRAGLTALGSLTMDDLEKEWIKEMAFEQGSRLLFLQANKMQVPPGDRSGASAIPYDDPTLVWVYPENETARNPLANEVE